MNLAFFGENQQKRDATKTKLNKIEVSEPGVINLTLLARSTQFYLILFWSHPDFVGFLRKRLNSWMSRYYLKAVYHRFCRVISHYYSIIYFVSIVCYAYLKALFANTNRGRCKREIGHERTRRTRRRTRRRIR